jgi:hypothetical protein
MGHLVCNGPSDQLTVDSLAMAIVTDHGYGTKGGNESMRHLKKL